MSTLPPSRILVSRLNALYPALMLQWKGLTVKALLRHEPIADYADETDSLRDDPQWHVGRVRYFYEMVRSDQALMPIEIDNRCEGMKVYPFPLVLDGHHRFAAAFLAKSKYILADYSGRVDLRRYLEGKRKICPQD